MEGATVGLIAAFLQGITNPEEPSIKVGINWIDTVFLASEATPEARILRLAALLLMMVWLRSIFVYLGFLYLRATEANLIDAVRKRIFEQFQSLSMRYYSNVQTGSLVDIVTNQLNQFKVAATDVSNLFIRFSTLIAYIVAMVLISWQLCIIAILLYTLLSVGVSWMVRRAREAGFAVPKAEGNLASLAIEIISGIRTIQGSATQDFERKRFYQCSEEVREANIYLASLRDRTKPIAEGAATTILISLVIISFLFLIRSGQMKAASLLTFMFVLFRMMPLVSQVNTLHTRIISYQGFIDAIQEVLRTDNKPYISDGSKVFEGLSESIRFNNVSFSYDLEKLILKDITLEFEKGQTTALVGASGAGKTTLADMIPRFYDPIQGTITIDNVDLREFKINSLRQRMSVVSQNTFIFNRSVRENIAYGLENVSDSEIYEASQFANALDFILEMPEGFETVLGDRGIRLSGGQRQRIAIARALLRNPEILILDEATSALDSVTERLIQDSLEKLSSGRTVITIAHRLSTIMNADKIVVLEQGQVVEQGEYQELLAQRGALWQYHQTQFSSKDLVNTEF